MTVSQEPLVSVVTPFYNTQAYLSECIESVLRQTYQNFELVLVDNHSTDRSAAIAAGYAGKDPRVRLIRTPSFFPQVENYNFALQQISPASRYCKIVQADDWIYPRCLTEMVDLAEAQPTTAIISSYRLVETQVDGSGLSPRRQVLTGKEACRLFLLGGPFLFGSPTTVLYRADVVRARTPFFEIGRIHEDTEAVYEILNDHAFGFVHQVLSFSRRTDGSITAGARTFLPELLDRLILLKRFGGRYLRADELEVARSDAHKLYYQGLAQQWLLERFAPRDERFWQYQRDGLATMDESIRPDLLARHVALALAGDLLFPRRLLRRFRRSPNV